MMIITYEIRCSTAFEMLKFFLSSQPIYLSDLKKLAKQRKFLFDKAFFIFLGADRPFWVPIKDTISSCSNTIVEAFNLKQA